MIQQIIKKRKIKRLVHFSDIRNHCNIFKDETGLLSIKELKRRNIEYYRNDLDRYDNKLNYISVSITNINYFLIKVFAQRLRNRGWVIYDIDPKILLKKKCLFYSTNAANSLFSGVSKSELRSYKTFEDMFADEVLVGNQTNRHTISRNNELDNETTCNQAEILIHKRINFKYIIGFENITV